MPEAPNASESAPTPEPGSLQEALETAKTTPTSTRLLRVAVFLFVAATCAVVDLGTKEWAFGTLQDHWTWTAVGEHVPGVSGALEWESTKAIRAGRPYSLVDGYEDQMAYWRGRGSKPLPRGWGFAFIRAKNIGAAFSLFEGKMKFFFVVSGIAMSLLCYFAWAPPVGGGAGFIVLLGMLGGGVIGNLHDRAQLGYVRDFLDFYVTGSGALARGWRWVLSSDHWPTFNVADMCIVVGAICLFLKFAREPSAAASAPASEAAAAPKAG